MNSIRNEFALTNILIYKNFRFAEEYNKIVLQTHYDVWYHYNGNDEFKLDRELMFCLEIIEEFGTQQNL